MKVKSDKSHLLMSRNKTVANTDNNCIESKDIHELLGITIDSKLTFENHINKLCKQTSQKLNAIAQISNYITFHKRKIIMTSFITSRLSYCRRSWMFHSKRLSKKINALHERTLRITYGYKTSSFHELLEKDNSVSIHHKNLQTLATEMGKVSGLPLITCVTQLVLKCEKSTRSAMVLKIYRI